ncbi:MAG TPA: hypothetical protein VGG31_05140 [Candidatus Dormibacteraeota bacterium]
MSTMFNEINQQVKAGRGTINRSVGEIRERVGDEQMARIGMAAAAALVAIALGVGVLAYRRRRRRTLGRIHAISGTMRDLNSGLRSQLKDSLEKAAKSL